MEKALIAKQGEIVNIEDQAMSIETLLGQVKLIQDVMDKVMKKVLILLHGYLSKI